MFRDTVTESLDAAAERVRNIMAGADENYIGVKIGVKNGGCAGMEYTMDYATEAAPLDEVVEETGIKIEDGTRLIDYIINGL